MPHDPYYDLVPQPREVPFVAEKTALLTIDLQYLDAHPDGWMGRLCREQGKPDHLKERFDFIQDILPNVRKLQDACRANGVEVIHIRVKYATLDCRDGSRSLAKEEKAVSANARDDDFLEEIAPTPDEIIIDKTTASAFSSSPIDQILRNMGVTRLWVTGIVTEGCVEMTTRDAADRGYFCTLVSDACASSTHLAHYDALQRMGDQGLIKVRTTEQLVAQLEGVRELVPA